MACLNWWSVQRPRLRYPASSSSAFCRCRTDLPSVGHHMLSNILLLNLSNSVGSCVSENCSPLTLCTCCLHHSRPQLHLSSHDGRFWIHLHSCDSAAKLVCSQGEYQVLKDRHHDHVQNLWVYLLLISCDTCSPFQGPSHLMLAADRVL